MFGFISAAERGVADRALADLADRIVAGGHPLVAMVRAETEPGSPGMALRLLPSGKVMSISQRLGAGASACSLDSGALETAVALTGAALDAAPEGAPLILNKFSHAEASGHGTRPLIAQALSEDRPVLLSVPAKTRAAFDDFACGLATELPADPAVLLRFLGM